MVFSRTRSIYCALSHFLINLQVKTKWENFIFINSFYQDNSDVLKIFYPDKSSVPLIRRKGV